MPLDLAHVAPPRTPTARLGRAARFAFGAAIATSVGVTGCSEAHTPSTDAGRGGADARPADPRDAGVDSALVAAYGGPPDAGVVLEDAGEEDAYDSGDHPIYGGPPDPEPSP